MAEIIGFIFLVPAIALTLIALFATLPYLLPERTRQAAVILDQSPGRSFIIGFVNLLFFGVVAIFLSQSGEFAGLLALLILLALLAAALPGFGGVVRLLQTRIFSDSTPSDLNARLKTAVLLTLALLSPIIGWFILLPLLYLLALGAGLSVLLRRSPHKPDEYIP
jgi:hypothetical protein